MDFDLKAMADAVTVNDRLADQAMEAGIVRSPAAVVSEIVQQNGHEIEADNLDGVADQRGLRLALAANGRFDELKRVHDEGPDFVRLDANESIIQELGKVSFLDGFAACARLFLMAGEDR